MTLTTEKTKNEETIRGDSSWAQDEVIKCQVGSQVCLCSAAVQPILDSDTEWCRLGNTPNDARWPHSFEGKSSFPCLLPPSMTFSRVRTTCSVRPSADPMRAWIIHDLHNLCCIPCSLSQRASRMRESSVPHLYYTIMSETDSAASRHLRFWVPCPMFYISCPLSDVSVDCKYCNPSSLSSLFLQSGPRSKCAFYTKKVDEMVAGWHSEPNYS